MEEPALRETKRLAELAGIQLPDKRVSALAAGLQSTRQIVEALTRLDYGETEPACQFRAPRSGSR